MIVVFGGAFNPPTRAHYEIAKHVITTCDVDEFLFVPVGDQYAKAGLISARHRIAMLNLLCDSLEKASVVDIETKAHQVMKTYETLTVLKTQYPQQEIAFIMGADNLIDLADWYQYERLILHFKVMILNRDDANIHDIISSKFAEWRDRFLVIDEAPHLSISSSAYRASCKAEQDVLPEVSTYIKNNHLYGR